MTLRIARYVERGPWGRHRRPSIGRRSTAPPDDLPRVMVEVFQALADPTRARVLDALAHGPLRVRDLALVAGVAESSISHQLRYLCDRRLVKPRRDGVVISYALDDHRVGALPREAEHHADHVRQGLPDHP